MTLFLYDFMGSTSVSLLQGLGLEVNGIPVRTPYNGNGVSIVKQRHNVRLTTNYIGLRLEYPFPASVFWILSKTKLKYLSLIWDGRSMLEISVEPKLREKLFGMCGNFNGDPNDDFRSAKTNQNVNLEEFTESWRLGDQAQCTHRPPKVNFPRHKSCRMTPSRRDLRSPNNDPK